MQTRTQSELLEPAINKLVRALKRDLQKRHGHLDYEKLRKDGFSDLLLARLRQMDGKRPPSSSQRLRA